jgi:hypothetical protein
MKKPHLAVEFRAKLDILAVGILTTHDDNERWMINRKVQTGCDDLQQKYNVPEQTN